jgi:hypothetical protein
MDKQFGIVQISDISVGYGNYDSLSLVSSVQAHYGLPALILEPDQWDKPLRSEVGGIAVKRLPTSTHFRSVTGRIEFILSAADWVNRIRPKVLIIRCSWNIPVLLKLKRKPPLVIYHSTESTLYYGDADPAINRLAAPMIDVVVFPEENRAMRDLERCGFHSLPMTIAYNCPMPRIQAEDARGVTPRNGRVMYSGALDRNATYVEYYANPQMRAMPIDIYGYVGGSDAAGTKAILESLRGSLSYKGYVDTAELEAARGHYAFSLTIWNPSNENQHFACPCKFFESIGSLVPPIAAPHPQCKMLIERYGCGIVMEDWSFPAFFSALSKAMRIYETDEYDTMVEQCKTALQAELNWDHQFEKIKPLLPTSV